MDGGPYRPLMTTVANAYHLDPLLVEAIAWIESRWQADAFRFEVQFWDRYQLAKKPEYQDAIPRRVSARYGLMQIMYVTARELGFDGEPELLFVPRTNLHFGCKNLQSLLEWSRTYPAVPEAERLTAVVAAYNGGKGGNTPGTVLRSGQYVMRVMATHRALREGL